MSFDNTGVIFLEEGDFKGNVLMNGNKPIKSGKWFIMVQGSFCGWCSKAKPEFIDAKNQAADDVTFATIHVDSKHEKTANLGPQIETIFGQKVDGIPAFFLYNTETPNECVKYDGKATASKFIDFLNNHTNHTNHNNNKKNNNRI
jgi:thiol-disulfide isomerase/thioredoxin